VDCVVSSVFLERVWLVKCMVWGAGLGNLQVEGRGVVWVGNGDHYG
jgi:hypothetical protein